MLCVARQGALVLVDCHSGQASLVGVVGPGGVLAASLTPDEELLVFVTGAGVLLGMTPELEVLYEVRGIDQDVYVWWMDGLFVYIDCPEGKGGEP